MVRRGLRAAIFTALVFVLWSFSRPAFAASAPFCDDRGATALAAPPALEATGEAIVRARFSSCEYGRPRLELAVGPAHRILSPPADDAGYGWAMARARLEPAASGSLEVFLVMPPPCHGVRGRVERPPRG
jgi:hypothetical protein